MEREYAVDAVVSDLDAGRLEALLDPGKKHAQQKWSCSGIAVYAALRRESPVGVAAHSVVLPSDPRPHASLEAGEEPRETMAFVNHHRGGEIYPNDVGSSPSCHCAGERAGVLAGISLAAREIERAPKRPGCLARHPFLRWVRAPAPRVLRRPGERGRGSLRGRASLLEERAVAQAPLQRAQASVAVASRGFGASRGRQTRCSRGSHDLHRQDAPISG